MRCINYRSVVDAFEHRRRDIYWKIIGAALAIGKAHALRVTGANRAWGRNYSRAFCDWMRLARPAIIFGDLVGKLDDDVLHVHCEKCSER
jgi:hypothetical protein